MFRPLIIQFEIDSQKYVLHVDYLTFPKDKLLPRFKIYTSLSKIEPDKPINGIIKTSVEQVPLKEVLKHWIDRVHRLLFR